MSTFVKAEPSAPEQAVIALLERRGVKVPIVAVDVREAFLHPPVEAEVRVSQIGEPFVTPFTGGAKARAGGLEAADVRVVGYGVSQPDLDGILINRSHAHVKPEHRHLAESIDLLEIEVHRGPAGQVGALKAWSLTLVPAILPAVPPVPQPGSHADAAVRGFAVGVEGEVRQRVPGHMPYAGDVSIDAKARARVTDAGTPDADGTVLRKIALHVEAWPIQNRGKGLADATRRAVQVIDTLNGRAWPNLGRVQAVSIGEPTSPEGVREVCIDAELTVGGCDEPVRTVPSAA
jgi:hypothetical protein